MIFLAATIQAVWLLIACALPGVPGGQETWVLRSQADCEHLRHSYAKYMDETTMHCVKTGFADPNYTGDPIGGSRLLLSSGSLTVYRGDPPKAKP